jgi:hypothetical protein
MLAVVGFASQAAVRGTGPIQSLTDHIADPWNNNSEQPAPAPASPVGLWHTLTPDMRFVSQKLTYLVALHHQRTQKQPVSVQVLPQPHAARAHLIPP